jgi:hypothetical protein
MGNYTTPHLQFRSFAFSLDNYTLIYCLDADLRRYWWFLSVA